MPLSPCRHVSLPTYKHLPVSPPHSSLHLSLPSLLTLFVPLYIFDFSKDIHSCILLMVVCSTLHPTVMASMLRATVPRSNSCSIRLRFYRTETSTTKVRRSYLGVSLNRKRRGERGEGEEGRRGGGGEMDGDGCHGSEIQFVFHSAPFLPNRNFHNQSEAILSWSI